ncbi:TPA: hypothetical protein ACGSTL_001325 [Vibrio parahaemolyticus]|uniref:hypothetical protein n=1 Tax=Vibrio campbellii TaxID=680 RepID=UPI001F07BDBB|nr:hypothetical protein [Vibrio campbellii]UMM06770.1 hypothetical protein MKR81_26280 [Vibrio campbellii]
MASLHLELAKCCKGPIEHHRTVGNKQASKRLHIYFSIESRQRFVMTEEKTNEGRQFSELREEQPGKSLIAIEGECEKELGLRD